MAPKKAADTLVLVTGASGFVASHVVRELLRRGFRVRGTVRSLKNKAKVDPIRKLDREGRLELVEADLSNADCWQSVVPGCDFVQHVASPFPLIADEACVQTAVDGTLNVLKACAKCESVRKVMLTSSIVAIMEGHPSGEALDETKWSKIESVSGQYYMKSKTLAERAAWDFHRKLHASSGDNHFALSVVCPGFVLGPPVIDEQGSSVTLLRQLLQHELPALPAIQTPVVDVRDVALCHVEAMLREEANDERFMATSHPSLWFKEIAKTLADEFKEQGYCVSTLVAPNFMVRLMGFFDKTAADAASSLGVERVLDNSKARRVLGVEFRSAREAILSMAYALIERGVARRTEKYRGVPAKYRLEEEANIIAS